MVIRELRHVRIQSYIIHLYLGTGSHWLSLKIKTILLFCNHVGNICFTHSAPWWWVAERVTRVVMVDQWPNICKSGTRKYGLMPNPPHLQILHLIVNLNESNFSFFGSCPIFFCFPANNWIILLCASNRSVFDIRRNKWPSVESLSISRICSRCSKSLKYRAVYSTPPLTLEPKICLSCPHCILNW